MQRGPATPETFQGLHTPVYAADALYYFLTNNPQGFGTMDPTDNDNTQLLMDNLPMTRQGYMLRNSSNLLFFIYTTYNHLPDPTAQFVTPDDIMNQAFGGTIPAALYSYRDTDGKINNITMREAIERRLIAAPLNTYDVMDQRDPGFDRTQFYTHHLQTLAALNYFSEFKLGAEPTLAPVLEAIRRPDVREAMLREHNIIRQVLQLWQATLEPERRARRAQRQIEQQIQRQQNVLPPIQLPTVNPVPTLPGIQYPTVNPEFELLADIDALRTINIEGATFNYTGTEDEANLINRFNPALPTIQSPIVTQLTTPIMPTIPGVPTVVTNTQTTVPIPKVTIPPWVTQGKK
ncbi:Hypothetical protein HVR_LOCUS1338 [uncultured virus]|nr:Hypothetical protein HVR_LOCUS1338 [uncultured virus]